jgi:hypothetical protein
MERMLQIKLLLLNLLQWEEGNLQPGEYFDRWTPIVERFHDLPGNAVAASSSPSSSSSSSTTTSLPSWGAACSLPPSAADPASAQADEAIDSVTPGMQSFPSDSWPLFGAAGSKQC